MKSEESAAAPEGAEEPEIDEVDLEEMAAAGKAPPRARRYRIRIDGDRYVVDRPSMTGREILALAGKTPQTHILRQRIRGHGTEPVEPDQKVDFTRPGVERFVTLPRDQTDGSR